LNTMATEQDRNGAVLDIGGKGKQWMDGWGESWLT